MTQQPESGERKLIHRRLCRFTRKDSQKC